VEVGSEVALARAGAGGADPVSGVRVGDASDRHPHRMRTKASTATEGFRPLG
jgi:hypothetical protein